MPIVMTDRSSALLQQLRVALLVPALGLSLGMIPGAAQAQNRVYSPLQLPSNNSVADTLSEKDIPTGQGGFARDYTVTLQSGDQVAIDLTSEAFDTVATLLSDQGETVGENDDGPDGGTSSLLFVRITKSGPYVIRVRSFGEAKGGPFTLKMTRLKPI
jgi:hypothetical protein